MRTWLTWVIVIGFGVMVALTARIQEIASPPAEPPGDAAGRQPDSVLEEYRITLHAVDGRPRYRLVGPRLSHYPDDDSNHLEEPHLTVFAAADDPSWTVASETGWLGPGGDELLLNGPVTLERLPGNGRRPLRIDTSDLRVEPKNDFAETDRPVHVTGTDYVIDAVGADARLFDEGSLINLKTRVKGRRHVSNRQ
jgi:lipopolysaccharide export system protein LptC